MARFATIAVTSRSFSAHPVLRAELSARASNVRFNESGRSLAGEEFLAFLDTAERAIVALEPITAPMLDRLPHLKVIAKYGVGLDNIDLEACERRGIRIGWMGGVNRRSVAELAIALMIMSLRELVDANREILAGSFRQRKGRQLSGRTVGVLGCGHAGKEVARLARAFGCRVLAHDIQDFPEFYAATDVEPVDFRTLIAESDILTLHVPLTPATRHLIDAEVLAAMRPASVLVNTARGGIVDEAALKAALRSGPLAAAAFDVFAPEPPTDLELLSLPNFIATPHVGGSSEEAILAMGRAAIEGLFAPQDALSHVPAYLRR